MTVQASQVTPLNPEDVPGGVRSWVERGLIIPINRVLDLFRAVLDHGISIRQNVNAQVLTRTFVAPSGSDWSAQRLDTPSELSGPTLGIQVLAAYTVDGAGHDIGPVGSLSSPLWREVLVDGKVAIRLLFQAGLTAGTKYRLVLLAWGA